MNKGTSGEFMKSNINRTHDIIERHCSSIFIHGSSILPYKVARINQIHYL